VDIVLELGLQSTNNKTLKWLNRGHGLAEFVDAVLRIKKREMGVCAHMINDLPTDEIVDVMEGSKLLSVLKVDQVKCHSLYILEGTALGDSYKRAEFQPLTMDDFIERTIVFLEYLDPKIVVQRLLGRAPAERTLFCNWNTSWWKVQEAIERKMQQEGRYQGRCFDYLNGFALRKAF
jgi:radical SAM protein (TIGR01212 family)